MLVLTRKREQSIVIGDNVEIMVLGVSGDKVRLGITAPREVEVFRKEVIADRVGQSEGVPAETVEVEAVAEPEA
ncbi:MAG: carbon storage regulator CsrA [Thermoleophilia bacterium]|nr:carbon storage regulator CsrA [Thermoleophilia bacterium]